MDVRDVQLFKLEILKDVIKVCEKHNLTYYLYGGTLLGCIRHNGFIPWDDDIDIALKWNDYKKLLKKNTLVYGHKYELMGQLVCL